MTNKIKTAFGSVYAEESLKENTLVFLSGQIAARTLPRRRSAARRLALAAAAVGIFLAGSLTGRAYFTPSAYVDLDVNPSIELSINLFDRVIAASAYNDEGQAILNDLSVTHKRYPEAVALILDEMAQQGYLPEDGLISATLQVEDGDKQTQMLSALASAVSSHHAGTQWEAFPVDSAARAAAHDINLSPAKYLAILELQEVDPTTTIEGCRDHTIGELKALTRTHASNNHNTQDTTQADPQISSGASSEQTGDHDGKSNDAADHNGNTQTSGDHNNTQQAHNNPAPENNTSGHNSGGGHGRGKGHGRGHG